MSAEPTSTDPARFVLDLLFERMQIDDQWALRPERELIWWPHTLRQRVWTPPLHDHAGVPSSHVHIETDVTTGVDETAEALETVRWMNRSSMLSALVLADGRIRLHAAVEVSADNLPIAAELALHAMALQLVESSFAADTLVAKGCGRRDVTSHPSAGARSEPDEMLALGGLYADPDNQMPGIDFVSVSTGATRGWERATADHDGFTAEFALESGGAELVQMVKRQEGLATALFQATTVESHPAIGAGLLTALTMPEAVEYGAHAANVLNAANLVAPSGHALGAWWHAGDYGLTCSAFYPALAFRNDKPGWNERLFESLVWNAASMARWARSLLSPGRAS